MHQHTDPQPNYSEHLHFPDGDHVTLTVEDPNYVEARGHIAGEDFDVSLRSDAADDEGYLLINGNSPDALWNLPQDWARRFGHAMIGAAGAARLAVPEADSLEDDARISNPTSEPAPGRVTDASSERVALDGGHADVEAVETAVELTMVLGARTALGMALSPAEARRIGGALVFAAHRAEVAQAAQLDLEGIDTVTDLFRASQKTGVPASALIEQVTR